MPLLYSHSIWQQMMRYRNIILSLSIVIIIQVQKGENVLKKFLRDELRIGPSIVDQMCIVCVPTNEKHYLDECLKKCLIQVQMQKFELLDLNDGKLSVCTTTTVVIHF